MNKNIVVIAVLAILVVISAVQAFQLVQLKTDMSAGKISLGTNSKSTSVSTGNSIATELNDVNNLPQMVGGC
ncbi:hypothetical protein HYX18_04465 [Candidatus Woesearchaeota archaeon]|nr:hypothetical protein [Candidatus Woesearchaeota archaeon]